MSHCLYGFFKLILSHAESAVLQHIILSFLLLSLPSSSFILPLILPIPSSLSFVKTYLVLCEWMHMIHFLNVLFLFPLIFSLSFVLSLSRSLSAHQAFPPSFF